MNTITITYTLKYEINFAPEYKFSGRRCFNTKTGREIKQVMVGGSIGYSIRGKFHSLKKLKNNLRLVKSEKTPF
jgi:hypothetical protein